MLTTGYIIISSVMYKSMLSQKTWLWFYHDFSHIFLLSKTKAVFYQDSESSEIVTWQTKPSCFQKWKKKKWPSACSKTCSMEIYMLNRKKKKKKKNRSSVWNIFPIILFLKNYFLLVFFKLLICSQSSPEINLKTWESCTDTF